MSRIKKLLEDDKKEIEDLSMKRGDSEQLILNAVNILEENENLYTSARQALIDDDHARCMEIFNYFIENDLALRRIIADNKSPYSFKSLKVIIELQSYYNFFRITLLSEVVNYLILSYNQVKKHIEKEYDLAIEWYKYAEAINEIYINDLNTILRKSLKVSPDEHQVKIYNEVVDAFEEVKRIGFQSIRELLKQTIKNVTKPGKLRFD